MHSLQSQFTSELFAHPWDWTLTIKMSTYIYAVLFLVRLWAVITFWDLESFLSFETLSYCYLARPYLIPCTINDSADAHPPARDRQILSFCISSPSPKYDSANHLVRPKAGRRTIAGNRQTQAPSSAMFCNPSRCSMHAQRQIAKKNQICPDLNILSAVSYLI